MKFIMHAEIKKEQSCKCAEMSSQDIYGFPYYTLFMALLFIISYAVFNVMTTSTCKSLTKSVQYIIPFLDSLSLTTD